MMSEDMYGDGVYSDEFDTFDYPEGNYNNQSQEYSQGYFYRHHLSAASLGVKNKNLLYIAKYIGG